jgi:hypothetical protein
MRSRNAVRHQFRRNGETKPTGENAGISVPRAPLAIGAARHALSDFWQNKADWGKSKVHEPFWQNKADFAGGAHTGRPIPRDARRRDARKSALADLRIMMPSRVNLTASLPAKAGNPVDTALRKWALRRNRAITEYWIARLRGR